MTNDRDANQEPGGSKSRTAQAKEEPTEPWTEEQWRSLHGNPDEHEDLSYELSEWEQFETLDGTDQLMFLPADEEQIKDAAFVITETGLQVDLSDHC